MMIAKKARVYLRTQGIDKAENYTRNITAIEII